MPLAFSFRADPMTALQHRGSLSAPEIPEVPVLLAKRRPLDNSDATGNGTEGVRPVDWQRCEAGHLYQHAFKCLKDMLASGCRAVSPGSRGNGPGALEPS